MLIGGYASKWFGCLGPRSRHIQHVGLVLSFLLVSGWHADLPSFATESEVGFDTLAYLQFRVGEAIAPRCTERLPEYQERFNRALRVWSSTYRDRIDRGQRRAQSAAAQGKGSLDAEINRRAQDSRQEYAQMNESDVRLRCEAILNELRIEK